jgi:hypothetical protein
MENDMNWLWAFLMLFVLERIVSFILVKTQVLKTDILSLEHDPVVSTSMDQAGSHDHIITVRHESGKVRKYRGDCTVWRSYPEGKRQGTMTESWLCDIWKREKWKQE